MQTRMMLLATAAALALAPAAIAQESTQDPLLPPAQEQAPAEQAPMDSDTPQSEAPAQAPASEPAMGDDAVGDVVVEPAVTPPPAEALIQAQRPNEIRSENIIGATVINGEGEEVGKVKDILFDTSGTATGMVLSVGGIMGLGAKDVGLAWQEVDVRPEPDVVRINYTKAQLEAAPPFKTQETIEAEQSQMNQPGTIPGDLEEPAAGTVPPAPAAEPTQ
ncbi:PRC-barrel domain-containing protein [Dongia sp.]|uniref:PRC-barrel domain-containing protein n=1 Tax=Dongia sp. TaxID=1977262 RepID=UPI0035B3B469